MKRRSCFFACVLAAAVWTGCDMSGPGGLSGTDVRVSGIAVDPYIEGATFCEDLNGNRVCDTGEQLSTPSDAAGAFSFSEPLSAGSLIIAQTRGMHNGVPYALDGIAAMVRDPNEIVVVSPITTLETRGLTSDQIVEVLSFAGLEDITAADVRSDPMDGIIGLAGPVNEAQLARIRASIAVYAMLRIMNGSDQLRALLDNQLYESGTDPNGAVHKILEATVGYVKQGIDPNVILSMQAIVEAAPIKMPDVTAEDVVRTAVVITDYLSKVGFETANAAGGDWQAALAAVAEAAAGGANMLIWATEIGQRFYGVRNRAALAAIKAFLPTPIQTGIDCPSSAFIIDDQGVIECFSQ